MELTVSDVAALAHMSERLGMGPVGFAGRLGGLTGAEQEQVPRWAWVTAGVVLAVGAAVIVGQRVARHDKGSKV